MEQMRSTLKHQARRYFLQEFARLSKRFSTLSGVQMKHTLRLSRGIHLQVHKHLRLAAQK